MARGYTLVSGGTDNHLVLVDLKKSRKIDGARVERVLELANIATNKNTVPGDKSALMPGGIRMGTPAVTSRGYTEQDMETIAEFFDRAVTITQSIKDQAGKHKRVPIPIASKHPFPFDQGRTTGRLSPLYKRVNRSHTLRTNTVGTLTRTRV